MKRFLISSITILIAVGFFVSCASKEETMSTTNTASAEKAPSPTPKKSTKKSTKKKTEASPSPSESPSASP